MSTKVVRSPEDTASTGMLTKLLRGPAADSVQPVLWRQNAGPIAGSGPQARKPESQQTWPPLRPPAGNGGDDHSLPQPRLAELEAAAERRVREAAYREGEAAGKAQALAQVGPVLDKLARSLQEIAEVRPKLRLEAEADLLKLALAIARKILHRELSIDPDSLAGLVKVAVEKIRLQDIVRVRIHPQHQASVQQLLTKLSSGTQIELVPDAKLELGGLIVETTRGEWNASVETQLREIERGLTDRLLR